MTATKIDGTAIAKSIREGLKAEIAKIQESNPRFKPSLVIFQVGNRSDSSKSEDIQLNA
jgi:methylenetetrahydrofolate dehydrogenase (NADP+)/methenyltetrahydrofolate cyclohydrolase/formyltetrahydrofolate synthetase